MRELPALPEGYHFVTINKAPGVAGATDGDNSLFGKRYVLKEGDTLPRECFPNLVAEDGYKDPTWNITDPWDQPMGKNDLNFVAGAITTTFDKENITGIRVSSQPELNYQEGDPLDLSNLAVTLTDKNKNEQVVPYADFAEYGLETNPEDGIPLYVKRDNGNTIKVTSGKLEANTEPLVVKEALLPSNPAIVNTVREGDTGITGKGEPKADIKIKDSTGEIIANAVVDKDGNWSATLPSDKQLTEGDNLTVTQTEDNKAPTDTEVTVEKAMEPSNEPKVNPIHEKDPAISGQGEPGASVAVTDKDDKPIGNATVDKDGNWNINIPEDKAPNKGDKITVTQTEENKKATEVIVIVEKALDPSKKPEVNSVYNTDNEIAGRGVLGSSIIIKNALGDVIGQATVDNTGKWKVKLPDGKTLDPGLKLNVTTRTGQSTYNNRSYCSKKRNI